jgi:sulfite reductase (NADPH) flavoprotein alpha-component
VADNVQTPPVEARRKDHKQVFVGHHLARVPVTGARSDKYTFHHEIGFGNVPLSYRPGDALGVQPENDPHVIERILKAIGATGDELVGTPSMPLATALRVKYSLAAPSRRLLEVLASRGAAECSKLLEPAHAPDLKEYLNGRELHDVLDVLEAHPHVTISPAELAASLRTLLPRLYSIASSQLAHPGEVHVLVVSNRVTIRGRDRQGVASNWLNDRWPVDATAEMYLQNQQAHFAMPPEGSTPMIMVGPGTGVAPYRAFLEERRAQGATGPNWLFFGEQHRASEFYYQQEFEAYERDGFLRLETAFSRDQPEKIYVQHRMAEHAEELWRWLEDGAELFVCGDKARMAVDVERELHRIIEKAGGKTSDDAKAYVQRLKEQKRYKRDVY